jgi:hypothetical protein
MKNAIRTFALFTLISVIAISAAFAQGNPVKMKFTREMGKIIKVSKDKKKHISFTVEGLNTPAEVDNFVNNIKSHTLVMEVDISQEIYGVDRKGKMVLSMDADIDYLKKILTNLGLVTIYIDGEIKPVSEIGVKKTK